MNGRIFGSCREAICLIKIRLISTPMFQPSIIASRLSTLSLSVNPHPNTGVRTFMILFIYLSVCSSWCSCWMWVPSLIDLVPRIGTIHLIQICICWTLPLVLNMRRWTRLKLFSLEIVPEVDLCSHCCKSSVMLGCLCLLGLFSSAHGVILRIAFQVCSKTQRQ